MADVAAMDEGWLEESHYKMSKKIAQLTRVRVGTRFIACLCAHAVSPRTIHPACPCCRPLLFLMWKGSLRRRLSECL